jgi:hypothetical protein
MSLMTFRLTDEQAEHALALCERFPPRTGMYVSGPSWNTIDAFLSGYVASWADGGFGALQDFATERLGPGNLAWTWRLQQLHDPDEDRDRVLGRERGEEVANLLCSVIREFVQEQAARS